MLRLWQPTLTLSSTDMRSNSATFWKVRPMPICGMAWRGRSRIDAALEQDVAAVGRVEAAEAIEERGLAGAVGADQAGDLAGKDVEGDAVERDDAAEADRDVAHAEQRRSRWMKSDPAMFTLVSRPAHSTRRRREITLASQVLATLLRSLVRTATMAYRAGGRNPNGAAPCFGRDCAAAMDPQRGR